jgi:hypothetical protein
MSDGPPRTDEEVRGFLTRWVGGSNAGDWDAVAALMDVDIVYADPMAPTPARGRTAAIARAQQQYAPFPDGLVTMVGAPFVSLDEPELAYHWRFRGTHLHRVDPPGFAPTGQPVVVEGTSVLRFSGARVITDTLFFDTTEVARQLLAAPPAGSPVERLIAGGQRARVALRRWRGDGRARRRR